MNLENVSVVRWGRVILADISLQVAAGTCCAILGPNGSGKSMLLSVLSGYMWPTSGSVSIGGRVFGKVDLAQVRSTIGLIEPSRGDFGGQHTHFSCDLSGKEDGTLAVWWRLV
ncbi:MAG: ATP-binding cassette domain-containing protein [Sedimentisphaerales bacterium]|nr:ATP-binding cassette domain-containing protein [Sedimentisphaerales bacterium]